MKWSKCSNIQELPKDKSWILIGNNILPDITAVAKFKKHYYKSRLGYIYYQGKYNNICQEWELLITGNICWRYFDKNEMMAFL